MRRLVLLLLAVALLVSAGAVHLQTRLPDLHLQSYDAEGGGDNRVLLSPTQTVLALDNGGSHDVRVLAVHVEAPGARDHAIDLELPSGRLRSLAVPVDLRCPADPSRVADQGAPRSVRLKVRTDTGRTGWLRVRARGGVFPRGYREALEQHCRAQEPDPGLRVGRTVLEQVEPPVAFTLEVVNTGTTARTVTSARLARGLRVQVAGLPRVVPPGATTTLVVRTGLRDRDAVVAAAVRDPGAPYTLVLEVLVEGRPSHAYLPVGDTVGPALSRLVG